ncbi:2,3,4,5-tetrahydropyridine-2,6-dicarboxylate N-succinyltransferase [Microbacterium terrisoli]|jgi:2,3,4,5-tetrahydropyridine-2-carboxylate N-succinyltransferase|uniref:2,3,4,5-tetrahydropyridine-2,6-dicarboxylate N-succinyltransferase n=1 Tax=Microbacterium terrisoli TaxID=3242192 RepID=UPI002805A88F|nr:2,3,4,5-tetrahydropyridine-2,6-dicarboxylate N-succinyltransferase [Microbacterium protaetiae]
MSDERWIFGTGLSTIAGDGTVLDAWYPTPRIGRADGTTVATRAAGLQAAAGPDVRRGVRVEIVELQIALERAPASTADVYLRLHALSHRLAAPNTVNLEGIFGFLPTVAFTNAGPVLPDDLDRLRPGLRAAGIQVQGIDKFPRLTDYVTPPGVRIADAARVRLGAHLAPGTTVMHEGFVNYNAGTLGASMIEGRVSQGVVVGDGSDIGGGASIMGTLSGGGTHRVSIGQRCLLGANAGVGISLGDDCIVEAGLYLTGGTKVVLAAEPARADGSRPTVKAAELSGRSGVLYRRNSLSGAVEALPHAGTGISLNDALHA